MWYQNIRSALFRFVTIHASDGRTDGRTNRRTDGQNYDSQDRANIATRAVKTLQFRSMLILFTTDTDYVWKRSPTIEINVLQIAPRHKLLYHPVHA